MINTCIKEFQGEYRWLSNFYDCDIIINDIKYKSVEHAYQSMKTADINWKMVCSDFNNSAGKIKKYSKNIKVDSDWKNKNVDIMYSLLVQKYNKEPFYSLLLNTGDSIIQEGNTWNDTFFGIDLKTGIGKNVLGILIMKIRNNFKLNVMF